MCVCSGEGGASLSGGAVMCLLISPPPWKVGDEVLKAFQEQLIGPFSAHLHVNGSELSFRSSYLQSARILAEVSCNLHTSKETR